VVEIAQAVDHRRRGLGRVGLGLVVVGRPQHEHAGELAQRAGGVARPLAPGELELFARHEDRMGAEAHRGVLEVQPRPRRGLLEEQDDELAPKRVRVQQRGGLQLGLEVQERLEVTRAEVGDAQEILHHTVL
jgi:hypothetical protein